MATHRLSVKNVNESSNAGFGLPPFILYTLDLGLVFPEVTLWKHPHFKYQQCYELVRMPIFVFECIRIFFLKALISEKLRGQSCEVTEGELWIIVHFKCLFFFFFSTCSLKNDLLKQKKQKVFCVCMYHDHQLPPRSSTNCWPGSVLPARSSAESWG